MKYALFAGMEYYPKGGVHDFRGTGTIEELKARFTSLSLGALAWAHIIDFETMKIVCHYDWRSETWKDGEEEL